MAKIFNIPFATTGDREPIPQEAQEDNHVSYAEGYTEEYGLDPATSAEALDIERTKFNGLVHDITEAIFELQRHGVALWSADAAPYPAKARVYYSGAVWSSQSDNNSQAPGEGSAWVRDEVVFSTESQALLGEDASTTMSPLRTHQAFNQYGLGDSQINGPTIEDVDDHTIPAGFYAAVDGHTAGTHPPGAFGYSVLVLPYRLVAPGELWTQQIAVLNAFGGGHIFVRNYSGVTYTWGSWKRLLDDTVVSQSPGQSTTTVMSQKAVTDAVNEARTSVEISPVASSRILAASDAGAILECTAADGLTLTIPAGTFPIGSVVLVTHSGTSGDVTVAAGSGVTLQLPMETAPRTRAVNSTIGIVHLATDRWRMFGDLADA